MKVSKSDKCSEVKDSAGKCRGSERDWLCRATNHPGLPRTVLVLALTVPHPGNLEVPDKPGQAGPRNQKRPERPHMSRDPVRLAEGSSTEEHSRQRKCEGQEARGHAVCLRNSQKAGGCMV